LSIIRVVPLHELSISQNDGKFSIYSFQGNKYRHDKGLKFAFVFVMLVVTCYLRKKVDIGGTFLAVSNNIQTLLSCYRCCSCCLSVDGLFQY